MVKSLSHDSAYHYNRDNVVKLAQLICVHLEDKPNEIDQNKIFNCVMSCYDAITHIWSSKPQHYQIDVRMLIGICLATAGWFTKNQMNRLHMWANEQEWS